jgi:hypothetical protein
MGLFELADGSFVDRRTPDLDIRRRSEPIEETGLVLSLAA